MNVRIEESWRALLQEEFEQLDFRDLTHFVRQEYNNHTCYPKGPDVFAAFDRCLPKDLKLVILGQDPYHGPGQANGLCFSVHPGVAHPPSLINIFKEIESDLGQPIPESGDLGAWADQGVLLLNATLTVRHGMAGSHQGKGWERFTDAVIAKISDEFTGLVFLLWGGYAKKKGARIDRSKHLILSSGHPSPLSANRGYWFGNKHFSQANDYFINSGKPPIRW